MPFFFSSFPENIVLPCLTFSKGDGDQQKIGHHPRRLVAVFELSSHRDALQREDILPVPYHSTSPLTYISVLRPHTPSLCDTSDVCVLCVCVCVCACVCVCLCVCM